MNMVQCTYLFFVCFALLQCTGSFLVLWYTIQCTGSFLVLWYTIQCTGRFLVLWYTIHSTIVVVVVHLYSSVLLLTVPCFVVHNSVYYCFCCLPVIQCTLIDSLWYTIQSTIVVVVAYLYSGVLY